MGSCLWAGSYDICVYLLTMPTSMTLPGYQLSKLTQNPEWLCAN